MESNEELFGKLFNTIPLYSEEHLENILLVMDKENASYLLVQAVKKAFDTGIYSLGESEIISKAIRVLNRPLIEKEKGD